MVYRHRVLEAKLRQYAKHFPVLLLVGARQVGKSTLLGHLFGRSASHVVFDPVIDVGNARVDPEFFLEQHPPPILLDEIQYAPELLGVIKRRVDRDPTAGQYFLTGSQNLAMLRTVSESLAGRVIVLELAGMSLCERLGQGQSSVPGWLEPLLLAGTGVPDFSRCRRYPQRTLPATLFSILWRGGFPGTLDLDDVVLPDVFNSYVQTYVERDLRTLADVHDQQTFARFLGLCAALTAQEINTSQLGRELGVTPQTAARWLALLRATYQWVELPAYHGNAVKRLSSKPKGYVTDTGLAAFLHRISSAEALSAHPLLGALFETHVVLDLHRQAARLPTPPQWHHWRTHAGAEVDCLLERDGIVWPIEIKCSSRVTASDASGIRAFRATYPSLRVGMGIVVAAVESVSRLTDDVVVVPYDAI